MFFLKKQCAFFPNKCNSYLTDLLFGSTTSYFYSQCKLNSCCSNPFICTCPAFLHPCFQKSHAGQHNIWFDKCLPVLASSYNRLTDIVCVDIWQKTPCYLSHTGKQVAYHVQHLSNRELFSLVFTQRNLNMRGFRRN